MKLLFLLSAIAAVTMSAENCGHKAATQSGVFKARLETKALCMNYTIKLLDGGLDTNLISTHWIDEATNMPHENVFALANPCNFPKAIEQGDEFYFTIDTAKQKDCAVCMAYYPTPPKRLSIKVLPK